MNLNVPQDSSPASAFEFSSVKKYMQVLSYICEFGEL